MKIIDAVWEKRNLGVTCAEIEVGKTDSVSEVVDALRQRTEQYQVVKLAPGRADLAFAIQNEGFRYIETLFETVCRLDEKPKTPKVFKTFEENASYHYANAFEVERVLNEIKKGDIFTTDRIALDPFFSKQLAGRRYAMWMEDVLSRGNASMLIDCFQHENVGFSIHINKGRYYDMLLGGLFSEYLQSGFGPLLSYCSTNAIYEEGARKAISHVSSNNFEMLKIHMLYNGYIRSLKDVYIKHQ